jgi:hypothetical protein
MTLEQSVLETLRTLPPEKKQAVLDFAEFLRGKQGEKRPRRSLKGLCADLDVRVSESDIDEARSDLWSGFPREDV